MFSAKYRRNFCRAGKNIQHRQTIDIFTFYSGIATNVSTFACFIVSKQFEN